jgi:AcrR family transcriptional regulator
MARTARRSVTDEARRQQIMKAAERLFGTGRIHEVTLDEVARAARVGKGTIYRHFQDKDDLFFQTATSGFDDLCEVLQRRVPDEGRLEGRLLAACQQIVAFFDRRRHLIRMMQAEEGHARRAPNAWERWKQRRRRLVAAVADILAQGEADGEIRPDIPSEVLATYLLGLLRARANDLPDTPPEQRTVEQALDVFWSGARQRVTEETAR